MQEADTSTVALSASVGSLEVTIRGPLGEATRLLQHLRLFDQEAQQLASASASEVRARSPLDLSSSPVLPTTPPRSSLLSSPSVPAVQVPLQDSGPSFPPRSRPELEQTFPACPAAWLDRARVLGSANLSPRARILRAWKAGWARLVLAGDCAAPLPSETLQLASCFYPVVGGGSVRPAWYTSFRAYSSSFGALVLLTICLARLLL